MACQTQYEARSSSHRRAGCGQCCRCRSRLRHRNREPSQLLQSSQVERRFRVRRQRHRFGTAQRASSPSCFVLAPGRLVFHRVAQLLTHNVVPFIPCSTAKPLVFWCDVHPLYVHHLRGSRNRHLPRRRHSVSHRVHRPGTQPRFFFFSGRYFFVHFSRLVERARCMPLILPSTAKTFYFISFDRLGDDCVCMPLSLLHRQNISVSFPFIFSFSSCMRLGDDCVRHCRDFRDDHDPGLGRHLRADPLGPVRRGAP